MFPLMRRVEDVVMNPGRTPFTVAALVLLPLSPAPGPACERGKRHQAIRQVSFIHSSILKIEVFKKFSPGCMLGLVE